MIHLYNCIADQFVAFKSFTKNTINQIDSIIPAPSSASMCKHFVMRQEPYFEKPFTEHLTKQKEEVHLMGVECGHVN